MCGFAYNLAYEFDTAKNNPGPGPSPVGESILVVLGQGEMGGTMSSRATSNSLNFLRSRAST